MGTHRPGLDGLRAWAVIAVVAFHAGVLSAGWVGVDVFMALSGFLITRVIVGDLESSAGFRLRTFWWRRARRLVPGLLLLLLIVSLVTVWSPSGWPTPARAETIGALTYTSNWVRVAGSDNYWSMFAAPSALDHLWSLAVEEQFYLVWPLVALLAWRLGGRRMLHRVAGLSAVVFAVWQVVMSTMPVTIERMYVGTDTRAPAFLFGATAAMFLLHRRWEVARARVVLAAVGLVLIAACVVLDGQARLTYRGPLLVVGMCSALAAAAAAELEGSGRFDRLFTARWVRAVGRWSYGIYLFHWPLLVLLRDQSWSPWLRFVVVSVVATALAALSYEWYERPIRERRWMLSSPAGVGRRARLVRTAARVAVVGACLGTSAVAIAVAQVPRAEVDAVAEAQLRAPLPAPTNAAALQQSPPTSSPGPRPTTSIASQRPADSTSVAVVVAAESDAFDAFDAGQVHDRVLVVGDSVAFGLADHLVEAGVDRGEEVAVRAAPGCTMSVHAADQNNLFSRDLCVFIRASLPADVATFQPDSVVLLFGGTWSPLRSNGDDLDPCSPEGRSAFLTQGRSLLADVAFPSSQIFVAVAPRMAGEYVSAGADAAPCYFGNLVALAAGQSHPVSLVRLDRQVCAVDMTSCPSQVDGVDLRYDGLHFSQAGGAIIAEWLLAQIAGDRDSGG